MRGKWVNLSERRGVPLRLLKKEIPFLEVAAEILLPVKCTGKGLKGWGVVHVLTKGKCIIIYGKRGDNPPRLVPFFEAALFFIECITEA